MITSSKVAERSTQITGMRPGLSIYLDLVRLLAAVGVLLSHAAGFVMPSLPSKIATNGTECVAVFFVLSGFVIRFVSVEKGEKDWRTYLIARTTRIYSVALIAIVATFLIDHAGQAINPASYAGRDLTYSPVAALLNLSFLNEVWFTHTVFGYNEPFWSLGFEVPYYVFFGLVAFAPRRVLPLCLALWLLVYGPKIAAFLPLWLLGAALYEIIATRRQIGRPLGAALVAGSALLYVGVKFGIDHDFHRMYKPVSWTDLLKGVAYFHAIGLAVAMNFAGMDALLRSGSGLNKRMVSVVRWLANGSFTLYLVHLPLLAFARAAVPHIQERPALGAAAIGATFAVCYILAEAGERRKSAFKKPIERIVRRRA